MSGLPKGWSIEMLGRVCDVVRGITFPASSKEFEKTSTNVCCLRTTNIQREVEWSDVYFVPNEFVKRTDQFVQIGDALMSMANSYELVGKVAVVRALPFQTAFGAFLSAIRPKSVMHGQFLFHFLRSDRVQREIREGSSQTTNIANVSVGRLSEIETPIPPLTEQKRIADKLDSVLAQVGACCERLDRVPVILKRFRQAVLEAAISGALSESWREANAPRVDATELIFRLHDEHEQAGGHKKGNASPPTEDVHDLHAGLFPKGWGLVTLRDAVRPDRPITYGILKPGPEFEDGIPYIRVADYPNDQLDLRGIRKTSPAMDQEFRRSRLVAGDLLLSIRGTVGRLIVIPQELDSANTTQDSARLSIQPSLNRNYILWFLRSEFAQSRMRGAVKGVAVRGINIGDVRALQVPIPPRQEQDEIVRRTEALFAYADALGARYTGLRNRVDRLTPALLTKAFRGELVPQDPNDEPAEDLLTRIRAVRLESDLAPKRPRGRPRIGQPRAPKEKSKMTKSRNDPDVQSKGYLAAFLRQHGGPMPVENLFHLSELPLTDFYKQLAWEIDHGHIKDDPKLLEAI